MTNAELGVIQARAESVLAPYRMTDLGDGVRLFGGGKTPDATFQLALDCLQLAGKVRELLHVRAKYDWLKGVVVAFGRDVFGPAAAEGISSGEDQALLLDEEPPR